MKILATYHSKALMRSVNYLLWLPDQGVDENTNAIVFLHGVEDNYEDWIQNTRVIPNFKNKNTALIFPDGQNSFYVNSHESKRFADYVGQELPEHLKTTYHLTDNREKWAVCGNSMGGYGAIHTGWMFPETYSRIAGFSNALVVDNAINSTEDAPFVIEKRSFFETVFGDLTKLKGSENDLEALISRRISQGQSVDMYLKCGTEDFLINENRKFHQFLENSHIKHTYLETAGTHNWEFWTDAVEEAVPWLLNE
jgi:putative tributyrin esterase